MIQRGRRGRWSTAGISVLVACAASTRRARRASTTRGSMETIAPTGDQHLADEVPIDGTLIASVMPPGGPPII